MVKVVGLGAGGHAKVVIDILKQSLEYELVGLVDANSGLWGCEVLGVPVLGNDELLRTLLENGVSHCFIGLGSIGDPQPRKMLFQKAESLGLAVVSAIHSTAYVSPSVRIDAGITVMAKAVINADVSLGSNVLVNTGAIVEHDCVLENHVNVATGALLGGGVYLEKGSYVGIGAVVRQSIRIGQESIVGAGAVVVKDVPARTLVTGIPARPVRNV